jgi:hypothetical protein
VLCNMEEVEIRVCRMLSSTTTIAIKSLKMAPFEMLYGRRCRTPLFWSETGERKVFLTRHIAKSREASSYG